MDDSRVQRIEEAQAFADKRADDLDAAVRDLGERMLQILKRFEALEQRLEDALAHAAEGETSEDEVPPHSGRLPGGR